MRTYHPPLLINKPRLGFRFGQLYPAGFGALTGQKHLGQDYIIPIGTPLYALENGILKYSKGRHGGLTVNLVIHEGLSIRYMHLDRYVDTSKTQAKRGDLIGYSGDTGVSTAPHLHLDIYKGRITIPTKFANFIDPLSLRYELNKPTNNEDMTTQEIRAIVEAIYWEYAMRQPDKGGVDFWTEEYKREPEKAKWLGRILEGLRNEKINQKPDALRYLDAKENRWRTEKDVQQK